MVGSGVTGAEFARRLPARSARDVMLVSSRDRVLPGEDADAAEVLEDVFRRRGMNVHVPLPGRSRSSGAGDGVVVTLADGRTVEGSHCLMAVGSVPNTDGIGPGGGRRHGSADGGFVEVDRVSRTSAPGRVRGRRLHRRPDARLGRRDAGPDRDVARARRRGRPARPAQTVSSNVFTDPEIATVGVTQADVDDGAGRRAGRQAAAGHQRPGQDAGHHGRLREAVRAARAPASSLGGVVVAPRASELILPIALAVAAAAHRRPGRARLHRLPVAVRLDRRGGPPAAPQLTADPRRRLSHGPIGGRGPPRPDARTGGFGPDRSPAASSRRR